MDQRLLAWGLRRRSSLPRLWLFTDSVRLPDPVSAARRLPMGRAGVVFRHDGDAGRLALGLALARVCRARRLALVVAGDVRLAARLGAGVHLRGGRWPGVVRPPHGNPRGIPLVSSATTIPHPAIDRPRHRRSHRPIVPGTRLTTSSAHSLPELRRAARAGADLAFLSPAFPTASHLDAPGLGAMRWSALARRAPVGLAVAALGGIDGRSVHRLPESACYGAGAIGALG